ncbi:hypothetical protein VP1G_01606 [Cytospora mali]|uniref:Uncharacterized protein n=1 Tax=Cytospora mali TaxID=578113 RepID=A0A194URC8_CYTMA|nr:hypothetical protein VP1G_01606 [Valsa mali var. pyri (nom. inval.)]
MLSNLLPLILGLSAAVNAFPTLLQRQTPEVTPPKDEEFSLAMSVNGTYVSLTAVSNGTGDLVLQSGRLSVYPGTPAYINTTSSTGSDNGYTDAIVFDLTNSSTVEPGLYGLSVADLGELYGVSSDAFAVKDYQEFDFAVSDDAIYHKLTAASQDWFACADTINGVASIVLKWGLFGDDGSFPVGCTPTTVIQNFNVPGGATS